MPLSHESQRRETFLGVGVKSVTAAPLGRRIIEEHDGEDSIIGACLNFD